MKALRYSFFAFYLAALVANASPLIFKEDFESGGLAGWDVQHNLSEAKVEITKPGQLSEQALRVEKPDDLGWVSLARTVKVKPDMPYEITTDIRTEQVGYTAQYYLMITHLAKGQPVAANEFLYYDDGRTTTAMARDSTPITLGQWATRHLVKSRPGVDELRLTVVVADGRQIIELDNIGVEALPEGTVHLPLPPVFQKLVERTESAFDLDMLIPTFTYEIEATVAGSKDSKPVEDTRGMGVNLIFFDLHGKVLEKQRLLNLNAPLGIVRAQFATPDAAVRCRVELTNTDDLFKIYEPTRFPRMWQTFRIEEVRRDLVVDALMYDQRTARPNLARNDRQPVPGVPPVQLDEAQVEYLKRHLARRQPTDAEVHALNGGMTVTLNHRPQVPFISGAPQGLPDYNRHELLTQRGAVLVMTHLGVGGMLNQWVQEDQYDFAEVDHAVYANLAKSPDAYVYIYLMSMITPPWWGEKHPNDIIQMEGGKALLVNGSVYYGAQVADLASGEAKKRVDQGNANPNSFYRGYGIRHEMTYAPSVASERFRQDGARYLQALAKHIQSQPYANAVVGFHLLWGYDGQWNWPGYIPGGGAGPNDQLPDYSPAMQARFRAFLREKYRTDTALQAAWKDPTVTFDTAKVPTQARREVGRAFLDPAKDRAVIDYNTVRALCPAETLRCFAQALKEAFPRKILVGAYYNDIAILAAGGPNQNGQREILNGKEVDLFTGPAYEGRSLGMPGVFTYMTDSYRLHNKLVVTELDHRPFTVLNRTYKGNEVFNTAFKSVSMLQREFMAMICRGIGGWNLDMSGGWMDSPVLLDTWQQMFDIHKEALLHDRSSVARLAVFAGYESKNCQGTLFRGVYPAANIQYQRVKWNQAGVPVDQYLLPDIVKLKRDYDVYIFMNVAYLRPEERQAIEGLKRDGKVLVFFNAAGLLTESETSIQAMSDLVGMQIALADDPLINAKVVEPREELSKGLPARIGDKDYEREVKWPFFHVTDPAAKALAKYDDGRVAMAFKSNDKWTSLYIAPLGLLPEELYRNLARFKGAQVYCETNENMYFCKSYVGIHAATKGIKRIRFPKEARLRDLLTGRDYGVDREVVLNLGIGDNAFFAVENPTTAPRPGPTAPEPPGFWQRMRRHFGK